eukprot:1994535-Pleurochrysis_carterae.AAC.2
MAKAEAGSGVARNGRRGHTLMGDELKTGKSPLAGRQVASAGVCLLVGKLLEASRVCQMLLLRAHSRPIGTISSRANLINSRRFPTRVNPEYRGRAGADEPRADSSRTLPHRLRRPLAAAVRPRMRSFAHAFARVRAHARAACVLEGGKK